MKKCIYCIQNEPKFKTKHSKFKIHDLKFYTKWSQFIALKGRLFFGLLTFKLVISFTLLIFSEHFGTGNELIKYA